VADPTIDAPRLIGWTDPVACPACHGGYLVKRTGPHGDVCGCSRFPECLRTWSMEEMGDSFDHETSEANYGAEPRYGE